MIIPYYKNINILGQLILLEQSIEYQPNSFIPDYIYMNKDEVEQELMSILCWRQFSKSHCTDIKIQDYFSRIAKEFAHDTILHLKKST